MNIGRLFLGLDGRIRRRQFWIGMLVVWFVSLGLEWLCGVPITGDPASFRLRAIAVVIGLLTIYPTAAIAAKRLHDRNQSAAYILILVAALAGIQVGDFVGYFDEAAPMTWVKLAVSIAIAAVCLGYLIDLGFRRGTAGPNRYGPDPAVPTIAVGGG